MINLLPSDLGVKGEVAKSVDVVKRIAIIVGAIFLVLVASGIAAIVLLTTQASSIKARQENLKATLGNLEQAEQGIILLRDRIKKSGEVLGNAAVSDKIALLEKTVAALPSGVLMSEADIDPEKIDVTYTSDNSLGLAVLFNSLVASGSFGKVVLTNFSFNPNSGYLTNLELYTK